MIPVRQTQFGGPEAGKGSIGNCYPACLASILERELEDVPHFYEIHPGTAGGDNVPAAEAITMWLRGQGLVSIRMPVSDVWIDWMRYHLAGRTVILAGRSPRGEYLHAVVGKITDTDAFRWFEYLHDPHPSNAFLEGNPTEVEMLFGLDPNTPAELKSCDEVLAEVCRTIGVDPEDAYYLAVPTARTIYARSHEQPTGWAITDGSGKRYRGYNDLHMLDWLDDEDQALWFARQDDAEKFARDDEDAWHIVPVPTHLG